MKLLTFHILNSQATPTCRDLSTLIFNVSDCSDVIQPMYFRRFVSRQFTRMLSWSEQLFNSVQQMLQVVAKFDKLSRIFTAQATLFNIKIPDTVRGRVTLRPPPMLVAIISLSAQKSFGSGVDASITS